MAANQNPCLMFFRERRGFLRKRRGAAGCLHARLYAKLRRKKNSPRFDANSPFGFGNSPADMRFHWPFALAIAILAALAVAPWSAAQAEDTSLKFGEQRGSVSGLPLPRFVSLKADRVNLREGPSRDHRTTWVFQRAGLPVEVTAEFDVWCRVRDLEGTEGWVLHSLLSGRRTALVAPGRRAKSSPCARNPRRMPPLSRSCNQG